MGTRVPFGIGRKRAFKLLCPRCGKDRLFSGLLRMNKQCSGCGLVYEREPGYFLGSTYVNYGCTASTMTAAYMGLHFGLGYSNQIVGPPLLIYTIAFPVFFHRYARSLWLALDCYFDHTDLGPVDDESS